MRRATRLALAGLALASTPAQAAVFVYAAHLTGAQEAPPVATPATGFTTVTYDSLLHSLRIEVTFAGLIGTTNASHIHVRPTSVATTGGVATQVPSFAGFPLGVMSGAYDNTFDLTLASSWNPAYVTANGSVAGAEAAFASGLADGRAYLNVHSTFAPGGEIRGDLAAVPETATWAMMIVGFGVVGGLMRFRQRRSAGPRLA